MEKILSIIIPTYNMEKYLRYCLDSLLIKDNFDRLEVLVINDGSKDSSSEIAHSYEIKYPTVFKVIDKENGNYGSCVNRGLSLATGKYVKVLDADDSFNKGNFESFVAYLMVVDADLVLSSYVQVDESRCVTKCRMFDLPVDQTLLMRDVCVTDSFKDMQMHAVTYKRDNLIGMQYKQQEGISYTDQQWIFTPMIHVSSIVYFNKVVYEYLIGREGQTMDIKVRIKSIKQMSNCLLGIIDDYNRHSSVVSDEILEYLHSRLIPQIKDIYITSFRNYNKDIRADLMDFDRDIHKRSEKLYRMSEKTNSRINYMKFWRTHPGLNVNIVKLCGNLYNCLIHYRSKR